MKYYATSQKVAGPNHDEITGFFNLNNPSICNMALVLIQPLTNISTRNLPRKCVTHLHTSSVTDCLKGLQDAIRISFM
jgi:hypothetical protein